MKMRMKVNGVYAPMLTVLPGFAGRQINQLGFNRSSISYSRERTVYSPFSVSTNTFLELEQRWIRYDHVFAVCWVYSKIIRKKIGNTSENQLTCFLYYTKYNKGDGSYSLIYAMQKLFYMNFLLVKNI